MRRRTESRARRRQSTRMQTELHRPTQCRCEPTTISGNTNTSFAPLPEIKSPHKQTRPSIMFSSRATGARRKINRGAPPTTQERSPPWNASNTKTPAPPSESDEIREPASRNRRLLHAPQGSDRSTRDRTNTHASRESPAISAPHKRPGARHIRSLFGVLGIELLFQRVIKFRSDSDSLTRSFIRDGSFKHKSAGE